MTVRTRAQIKADAASSVPDNVVGAVDPAGVRNRVDDLADSAFLAEDIASTSEVRAKNAAKPLTMGAALDGAAWVNLGNLTGSVTLDFANWLYAYAALTGNITLGEPSSLPNGVYVLHVTHSGAARTIAVNASYWDTPGGSGLTLSTTSGQSDMLTIIKKPASKALIMVGPLNVGA